MLICEGACNPGLKLLDAQVAAAYNPKGEVKKAMDVEPLLQQLRQLQHTPHERLPGSKHLYICAICHSTRRY